MARTYILGGANAPRSFRAQPFQPSSLSLHPSPKLPPQRLGGPLSNEQKARLCMLSAEAFRMAGHNAADLAPGALDTFRHEQCAKATGKPGLTACTQDDWNLLHAHFLALVGRTGEAFHAAVKHGTEPERVAMHKLTEACQKAKLPFAYAAAICRRQYKCEPADANAKQLWTLVYTIINRGNARRKRG